MKSDASILTDKEIEIVYALARLLLEYEAIAERLLQPNEVRYPCPVN